jgi:mono/diheme cytochrome c family protein
MKPTRLSICFLLLAFTPAVAQSSGKTLTENPVFEKNCAKCHGKTAEGRHFGGPSLVSAEAPAMSPDDLRNIITNGKHHMPKYAGKLTPEDIDTLVAQIKAGSPK